jgi:SNF2 family DNA or RNA helicase
MVRNPRAFIFNDIGSGKTNAALWAVDYLKSIGSVGKVLISCPMSVMDSVWGDMLFLHFPHLKYEILHGSKQQRLDKLYSGADVFIINHDGCKVITDELINADFITSVIIDELAVMRNYSTDVTKVHDKIAGHKSGRDVWGLTGSPAPNKPTDVWSQARIINAKTIAQYFTRFREQVMKKISMYQWVPRPGWEQTVFSMLQPSIRFRRDECLDLPPCTTIQKKVELSKEQRKAYNELKTECLTELRSGVEISAANEAVKLS